MRIEIVAEEIKKINDFPSLKSFIDQFTRAYHIKHFAYFVNHYAQASIAGPILFNNYPIEIMEIYQLKNYFAVDPGVHDALISLTPFLCNHQLYAHRINEQQHELFNDFAVHEIVYGLICPIHAPNGERGGMCYIMDKPSFLEGNIEINSWELLCFTLICHDAARRLATQKTHTSTTKLSPREIECLKWSAQGKTSLETGIILGLSKQTVHSYLKSCFRKLNVTNKPQAIAKALMNGDILVPEISDKIHFIC